MADESKHEVPAVPLTGVWLLQDGHDMLVLVERDGRWYEAIREWMAPNSWDSQVSHCMSGDGLAALGDDSLVPHLNEGVEAPDELPPPWDIEGA